MEQTPRPPLVTAAGILLLIEAGLLLIGALFVALGALFAGAVFNGSPAAFGPDWFGLFGAWLAALVVLMALMVAGYGALVLVTGLHVLQGRPWARIGGIVLAGLGLAFAIAGIDGPGDAGGLLLSVAFHGVILAGLVMEPARAWFARPEVSMEPVAVPGAG